MHRLERLKKIHNKFQLDRDILLGILLIDEKDNHEYFLHKYKVSNNINEALEKLSKNLKKINVDKNFFEKNLIKNLFLNGKKHLIALNLINYSINSKVKLNDLNKNLKKILKMKVPLFPIDGKFLKQKGMQEGQFLGDVLKTLEKEWIKNNFKISNEKIDEIIKTKSD